MKEAALLKPYPADKGHYLAVHWGTKGGRPRIVPIQTDYQRDVLARAKASLSCPTHSMTPPTSDFKPWRQHYYYVCRQVGICRQAGITSHGLRHERFTEIYQAITGQPSPIQGGHLRPNDPSHVLASQEVAEVAGHRRTAIAKAYLGQASDA